MANLKKPEQSLRERFPHATIMKIRLVLREEALGMRPPSEELLANFINLQNAKLMKKKKAAIDSDKAREEIEELKLQIQEMENEKRGYTVFPRNPKTGMPCLYDFQLRGMFKEGFKALLESDEATFKSAVSGKVISKWSSDRNVDHNLFVGPRHIDIKIPEGGKIGICDRTLGTTDAKTGQRRNAIASSETVPAGSEIEFEVYLTKRSLEALVEPVLMYGELHGLGQWRNSGKGAYDYEIVSVEVGSDGGKKKA